MGEHISGQRTVEDIADRTSDHPMSTAALLVFVAVLPVWLPFRFDVLPAMLRMLLLQSNNLLVPFGVTWAALGVLLLRRTR